MPKWWEIAKDNAAAKVSRWWEKDSSSLPVESKPLVEVKTPILKESSWLNMDAIHFIESTNGKDKKVYKKDGKTYNDSIPAIGEYQIKPSTFRDPGQRLINKYGAISIQDPMNATTAEHREFATKYILAMKQYFQAEFSYKEKINPGSIDYNALAIAGYSRGFPKIKNLVKKHGSDRWREHVIYDERNGKEIKGDVPGGYLYKYNKYNKENSTGFKQVQKEVNNEGIA